MISGSGSALLDPSNLQALVDGCTDQEFRVEYKDEQKVCVINHCSNSYCQKVGERVECKSSLWGKCSLYFCCEYLISFSS